jgi:hypothetical protein
VPNEKGLKFDSKVMKCIFISYGVGVNVYKLQYPIILNIFCSRSVIFREVKYFPIVALMEEDKKKSKFQ